MRFTWIVLPVLLVTLTSTDVSGGPPPADESRDRDSKLSYVVTTSSLPMAAMQSNASETRLTFLAAKDKARHTPTLGDLGDPLRSLRDDQVRVRIRMVDRARSQFVPELTRATTGFLSFCATACPPPAIR